MKRIQLKHNEPKPPQAINIGRPSKWASPFRHVNGDIQVNALVHRKMECQWVLIGYGDENTALALYRALFYDGDRAAGALLHSISRGDDLPGQQWFAAWKKRFAKLDVGQLGGRDLACRRPLHEPSPADVLIGLWEKRRRIEQTFNT